MTQASITTSKPDKWTCPRPYTDASFRYRKHGAVRPLVAPSWLERLLTGAR